MDSKPQLKEDLTEDDKKGFWSFRNLSEEQMKEKLNDAIINKLKKSNLLFETKQDIEYAFLRYKQFVYKNQKYLYLEELYVKPNGKNKLQIYKLNDNKLNFIGETETNENPSEVSDSLSRNGSTDNIGIGLGGSKIKKSRKNHKKTGKNKRNKNKKSLKK